MGRGGGGREGGEGSSSMLSREQRNLREKERRLRMKHLYSTLSSLVSPNHRLPIPQLIDQATLHMIQMKEVIKELKRRKEMLHRETGNNNNCVDEGANDGQQCSNFPILQISFIESTIKLNLIISALNTQHLMLLLREVISVFGEEGAEVVSVTLHNMRDRVIYIIIAQAISPRIGIETQRIEQKLREIIY